MLVISACVRALEEETSLPANQDIRLLLMKHKDHNRVHKIHTTLTRASWNLTSYYNRVQRILKIIQLFEM
jgi:8-oxo-dGTP pyrophosphatase MutT (NUDIX family)